MARRVGEAWEDGGRGRMRGLEGEGAGGKDRCVVRLGRVLVLMPFAATLRPHNFARASTPSGRNKGLRRPVAIAALSKNKHELRTRRMCARFVSVPRISGDPARSKHRENTISSDRS